MTENHATRGSLITFRALDCDHVVRCYSLMPTPLLCDECANKQRQILSGVVRNIASPDLDELLSRDGLDEWLDDAGITSSEMRADITRIADLCDDARLALDRAVGYGRRALAKYPEIEPGQ